MSSRARSSDTKPLATKLLPCVIAVFTISLLLSSIVSLAYADQNALNQDPSILDSKKINGDGINSDQNKPDTIQISENAAVTVHHKYVNPQDNTVTEKVVVYTSLNQNSIAIIKQNSDVKTTMDRIWNLDRIRFNGRSIISENTLWNQEISTEKLSGLMKSESEVYFPLHTTIQNNFVTHNKVLSTDLFTKEFTQDLQHDTKSLFLISDDVNENLLVFIHDLSNTQNSIMFLLLVPFSGYILVRAEGGKFQFNKKRIASFCFITLIVVSSFTTPLLTSENYWGMAFADNSSTENYVNSTQSNNSNSSLSLNSNVDPVNSTIPNPVNSTIPNPVNSTIPNPVNSTIPNPVNSTIPNPVNSTIPNPVNSTIPNPVNSTIPNPVNSTIPNPVNSTIPNPVNSTIPNPVNSTIPNPVNSTIPNPVNSTIPNPVNSTIPNPVNSTIPNPVNSTIPNPVNSTIPNPVNSTIPNPVNSTIPNPVNSTIPNPVNSTIPNPVNSTIPNPVNSTIPNPVNSTIPNPVNSTIPNPVNSTIPNPVLNSTITYPVTIRNATQSWQFDAPLQNLTMMGKTKIENDSNITSLKLVGTGYVVTKNNSTRNLSSLTISAWVKPDYSHGSPIFTIVSKENQFSLSVNNIVPPIHTATFSIFDGIRWQTVNSTVQLGENWTHLIATFNGTTIGIYVNGTLQSTLVISGVSTIAVNGMLTTKTVDQLSSNSDIVVGASLNTLRGVASDQFSGSIENVNLYDSQLSPSEIAKIYHDNPLSGSFDIPSLPPTSHLDANLTMFGNTTSLNIPLNNTSLNNTSFLNNTLLLNNTTTIANFTLMHAPIQINKPVIWTQNVTLSNQTDRVAVELPQDAQVININIANNTNSSTIYAVTNVTTYSHMPYLRSSTGLINNTDIKTTYLSKLEFVNDTNNTMKTHFEKTRHGVMTVALLDNIPGSVQNNKPTKLLVVNDTAKRYNIRFETPAPYVVETNQSTSQLYHKTVIVEHNSTLHYTNVQSYSNVPENLVSKGVHFKLFWMMNGSKIDVTNDPRFVVQFVDTNNNGIVDQMKWIVPKLSAQEFSIEGIIDISNAQLLDSSRNFVRDVYPQVQARDGNWTGDVPVGNYVRVTFGKNLTNINDITIFAKSNYSNASIEVYEKDSNRLLDHFGIISQDGKYKILLTNFNESQDTFDLKIIGNPVNFDYIVDPSFTATPSDTFAISESATMPQKITTDTLPLSDKASPSRSAKDTFAISESATMPQKTTTDTLPLSESATMPQKTTTDTLPLSESATMPQKITTDTLPLSDKASPSRSTKDTFAISESASVSTNILHSVLVTDTLPLSDNVSPNVAITDTFAISDLGSTSNSEFHSVLVTDTLPLSDKTSPNIAVTDTLPLSDNVSPNVAITDTFAISDLGSTSNSEFHSVLVTDTLPLSDNVSPNVAVTDTFAISESASVSTNILHSVLVTDTLPLSDNVSPNVAVTDTFAISESASVSTNILHSVLVTDTLPLSDNVSPNVAITDTFAISDLGSTSNSEFHSVLVTDTLPLSDKTSPNIAVTDTLPLSDNVSPNVAITDTFAISDLGSTSNSEFHSVLVTDTLPLSDNVSPNVAVTDTFAIDELIVEHGVFFNSLSESMPVTDTLSVSKTSLVSLTEPLLLSNTISTPTTKTSSLTDSLPITDTVSTPRTKLQSLTDGLALSDMVSKQDLKIISDGISLSSSSTGTSNLQSNQNLVEAGQKSITIDPVKPELLVVSNDISLSNVVIPSTVPNPVINYTAIQQTSGSTTSVLVTNPLTITRDTSGTIPTVKITIPGNTTITGNTFWNGGLVLPTIQSSSTISLPETANQVNTPQTIIKIGSDVPISFNKPVRLLFAGQAGLRVGFFHSSPTVTEITATCTSDSLSGIPSGSNECKINVGHDLVVLTNHFTGFATWSSSSVSSGTSVSSTGTSSGGGGGGIGVGPSISSSVTSSSNAGGVGPYLEIQKVSYDICDKQIVQILVGTDSNDTNPMVIVRTSLTGTVDAKLASDQPYAQENVNGTIRKLVYEAYISPKEKSFEVVALQSVGHNVFSVGKTIQITGCNESVDFTQIQSLSQLSVVDTSEPRIFDVKLQIGNGAKQLASDSTTQFVSGKPISVYAIVNTSTKLVVSELRFTTIGSNDSAQYHALTMNVTPLQISNSTYLLSVTIPSEFLQSPGMKYWVHVENSVNREADSDVATVGVKPNHSINATIELDLPQNKAAGIVTFSSYVTNNGNSMYGIVSLVVDNKTVYDSPPQLFSTGQTQVDLKWNAAVMGLVSSHQVHAVAKFYDTSFETTSKTFDVFRSVQTVPLSQPIVLGSIKNSDGIIVANPTVLYSSFDNSGNMTYKVTAPDGTCVIGTSDNCLVTQSVSGSSNSKSIVIGDQIYRIRYSGPTSQLERFSITSVDPITGQWKIEIDSQDGLVPQYNVMDNAFLKIKYDSQ